MVRILMVCTGNICRSPMAKGVFQQMLEEAALADQVSVDSAGTHAYHLGSPPDERSRMAALRRGVDLSGIRARRIVTEDFESFDYVLAMDRDNYQTLQAYCGSPENRHKIQMLMEYAPDLPDREVLDPYYGGVNGFERVMDLIEEASRGLLAHLRERYRF